MCNVASTYSMLLVEVESRSWVVCQLLYPLHNLFKKVAQRRLNAEFLNSETPFFLFCFVMIDDSDLCTKQTKHKMIEFILLSNKHALFPDSKIRPNISLN